MNHFQPFQPTYRVLAFAFSFVVVLLLGGKPTYAGEPFIDGPKTQICAPSQSQGPSFPIVPLSSLLAGANQSTTAPNGALAPLVIPCTRDCGNTCEVCVPPLGCSVEPICWANCERERAFCWTLVDLYKGYFSGYVQNNVTYNGLSPQVRNAMSPYVEPEGIPRAYLDEITVGTSGNAGENNAMTDCDKITWINSPTGNEIEKAMWGVHRNRNDILSNSSIVHWTYHEWVHTFQCNELGGRTEYAFNWWSELPLALLDGNGDPTQIHAHQPSEQNADARADLILERMPVIVPRYVNSVQPLNAQLTGSTVTFRASASNVMRPQTISGVSFGDWTRFLVYDEAGNLIVERTANPVPGEYTNFNVPVYTVEGNFSAQWAIPEAYEGQTLTYRFQILDNNDYLMDESSEQFLGVVKRYIYVDKDYAGGGSDGTAAKPYRTLGAALGDPDAGYAASALIAPGNYAETPTIAVPIILQVDGPGIVTIGQ
jgi:hypothetical protein